MNIPVKSCHGISVLSADTYWLAERKLFIEGEITHDKACEVIKGIMYLNKENFTKPVYLYINSEGGNISAGMLIYDAIQISKAPVITVCMGRAYSMGALLFASGNRRYMFPNSELMLHQPLLGNPVKGNASSIKSISDFLLSTKEKMNNILVRHTGKTLEEIDDATNYDHYFSPEESINFGLCDEIIDFKVLMGV